MYNSTSKSNFTFEALESDMGSDQLILKFTMEGLALAHLSRIFKIKEEIKKEGFEVLKDEIKSNRVIYTIKGPTGKLPTDCADIFKRIIEKDNTKSNLPKEPTGDLRPLASVTSVPVAPLSSDELKVEQLTVADPLKYYQELYKALQKGDSTAWTAFEQLPTVDKQSIFEQCIHHRGNFLHAAIDGAMANSQFDLPNILSRILKLDDEFNQAKKRLPLTARDNPNPQMYCRQKINAIRNNNQGDDPRFIACIKQLINCPINQQGDTALHKVVKQYHALVKELSNLEDAEDEDKSENEAKKTELLSRIRKIVGEFGADFTKRNTYNQSALLLVFHGDDSEIFSIFLDHDPEKSISLVSREPDTWPRRCREELLRRLREKGKKRIDKIHDKLQEIFNEEYEFIWDQILSQILPSMSIRKEKVTFEIEDEPSSYGVKLKGPYNHYFLNDFFMSFSNLDAFLNYSINVDCSTDDHFSIAFYFLARFHTWEQFYEMVDHDTDPELEKIIKIIDEATKKGLENKHTPPPVRPFLDSKVAEAIRTVTSIALAVCELIAEYSFGCQIFRSPILLKVMKYIDDSLFLSRYHFPTGLIFDKSESALMRCIKAVSKEKCVVIDGNNLQNITRENLIVFEGMEDIMRRRSLYMNPGSATNLQGYPYFFIFAMPESDSVLQELEKREARESPLEEKQIEAQVDELTLGPPLGPHQEPKKVVENVPIRKCRSLFVVIPQAGLAMTWPNPDFDPSSEQAPFSSPSEPDLTVSTITKPISNIRW